jgi:DNA-directed RNA polymerase subunit RPC12/RpoP
MSACDQCGKEFSSGQRLRYHINRKVCQKSMHLCSNCGYQFSSKDRLRYHMEHGVCLKTQKNQDKITSR